MPPELSLEGLEKMSFESDEEAVRQRVIDLRGAIFSFATESAPGPSGLRPDHLKDMVGEVPGRSW